MKHTPLAMPLRVFAAGLALVLGTLPAAAEQLNFKPFHENGIYELGERVGWTVAVPEGSAATVGSYRYVMKKNNSDVTRTGVIDLSSGSTTIETTLSEPAMLYVEVTPNAPVAAAAQDENAATAQTAGVLGSAQPASRPARDTSIYLGAAIAPAKLQPSVPRPADFDAFWDGKLKAQSEIPINPVLTPGESNKPGVEFYTVKLDSLGSHVQGYLAKPAKEGKFPALVIFQYAGVYALQPATVTDRAAEGWLTLDVDSHDIPPTDSTGVSRNYGAIGDTDRETSYFLNMYLRDTRAIDYLATRPDWDGKTIVIMGTSMGGQQSIVTAGLNPKVTAVIVNEPSGADSNGDLHGRKAGYPNWDSSNPKVMETAQYFDIVNFASRIKAPVLAAIGFIDTIAPPVGIWIAVNQIPGPKEVVPMVESAHNNITPQKQGAYNARYKEVLRQILNGGEDWAGKKN
jgi:cephalosporin-C deacetylase